MTGLMDEIRSWPFLVAYIALFCIVFLRAGGTYLIGRAIAAGAVRDRLGQARFAAAKSRIDRWGPIAVMLSFLTVGAQTAVNAAAGVVKMPWYRYLLGLLPGSAIWALVWSTVGMGAFYAVISARETNRGAGLIALLAIAVLTGLIVYISRTTSRPDDDDRIVH